MDEMPKRRKRKDNPYILSKDERHNIYLVSFKDGLNIYRTIRITKRIYEALNKFELEDLSEMNEYDLHIEHLPLDLHTITIRAIVQEDEEEQIIAKLNIERITQAIWKLPTPQNRRVYMYLIQELSNKEIAEIEKCDHSAISRSIRAGIKNLKEILKNF